MKMKTSKFFNPLLIAQQVSRNAVLEVAEHVDSVLYKLKVNAYISDYTIQVEPYNNGYEISIKATTEFELLFNLHKRGEKEKSHILNSLRMVKIYIQPDTFFNEKYENKEARMEARIMKVDSDPEYTEECVTTETGMEEFANYFKNKNKETFNIIYQKF